MNNQNMNHFNGGIEKAISIGKRIKDKHYKIEKTILEMS